MVLGPMSTQPPSTFRTQDTLPPAGPRILLVDDSKFSLSQLKKALGDGYCIDVATGGGEGLRKMESTYYDMVITDLLMPHISGLAFLGHVRARYPKTKVIVSSADIQDATASKARSLGAVAFVPKPVAPEDVRRAVNKALEQNKATSKVFIEPRYVDALKEIFNIGMGRAAAALSKLVYEKVKLSVPRLDVLHRDELPAAVAEDFDSELALVRQDFTGSAAGTAFLLMSKESGLRLLNGLVQGPDRDAGDIGEADQELLVEVGNILINALVGSMANTLGIAFELHHGRCDVGAVDAVCRQFQEEVADHVLLVETLFLLPGRHIGGNLLVMMTSEEMGHVLQSIDKVF